MYFYKSKEDIIKSFSGDSLIVEFDLTDRDRFLKDIFEKLSIPDYIGEGWQELKNLDAFYDYLGTLNWLEETTVLLFFNSVRYADISLLRKYLDLFKDCEESWIERNEKVSHIDEGVATWMRSHPDQDEALVRKKFQEWYSNNKIMRFYFQEEDKDYFIKEDLISYFE